MSSSSYILLLFLCIISLHACNARRHPSSDLDKKMEKKPHFSLKINVEKSAFDCSRKKLSEGDNKMKAEFVADSEKSKHQRSTNQKVLKDMRKVSAELQTKSHVSVSSLRVPHNKKKHSEKHPGFNLDYSPPKTHPPSHN